jgi:hypothetical protein
MRVTRGTFRASILIAFATFVSGVFFAVASGNRAANNDWQLWNTLRCGKRFLDQDMSKFTNDFGNIDIGKAGCSDRSFLANFDEIRDAIARPDSSGESFKTAFWLEFWKWMQISGAVFICINLIGFLALAILRASKWVFSGYRGD